jgi:hypothetical protein
MDLETRIRSRIETILASDARQHAHLRSMLAEDEPLQEDPFEEERNLYQRIISNYRSAVNDVNALLEENIAFLSLFSRIVDNIKGKGDFHEICSVVADALLQDLGVEYCGVILFGDEGGDAMYLEGIREDQKFLCLHSERHLLGSREFEEAARALVREAPECAYIPDVTREARFRSIDFPSVVRSLVCLPVVLGSRPVGALLTGHSLPRFFNDNHLRLLKILSGIVSHSRCLTDARASCNRDDTRAAARGPQSDVIALVIMSFDSKGAEHAGGSPDRETLMELRSRLTRCLEPHEIIVLYDERQLLMLSPGTPGECIPPRVARLQEAFRAWHAEQPERLRGLRMSIGYSACEATGDIARTLEIASIMIRPT